MITTIYHCSCGWQGDEDDTLVVREVERAEGIHQPYFRFLDCCPRCRAVVEAIEQTDAEIECAEAEEEAFRANN